MGGCFGILAGCPFKRCKLGGSENIRRERRQKVKVKIREPVAPVRFHGAVTDRVHFAENTPQHTDAVRARSAAAKSGQSSWHFHSVLRVFFFLMIRRPPRSTLFPVNIRRTQ